MTDETGTVATRPDRAEMRHDRALGPRTVLAGDLDVVEKVRRRAMGTPFPASVRGPIAVHTDTGFRCAR